jgi:hypothetical protein
MRFLGWLVLLPLWRRVIRDPRWHAPAAIGTGIAWVVVVIVIIAAAAGAGGGDGDGGDTVGQLPSPSADLDATATSEAVTSLTATAEAATPQPTPTEAPEPTPAPEPPPPTVPPLEILNTSSRTDAVDSFHVVGEVLNNSDGYVEFVEVAGTFFDIAGDVIASEAAYTLTGVIPPWELAPFALLIVDGAPLGIADFQLQVQGDETDNRPVPGLSIRDDTSNVDSNDSFHVVGEVINESTEPYDFVQVIGTFYDATGAVVAADFTFTERYVVKADGSSPFELVIVDGGTLGIASYKLTVEGSRIR